MTIVSRQPPSQFSQEENSKQATSSSLSSIKTSFKGLFGIFLMLVIFIFTPVIVASVTLPFLIEWPLSLYLATDVTHITQSYSYKPGSHTTEYQYFYQQNDGGYQEFFPLVPLALASLFYLAILISASNIYSIIKKILSFFIFNQTKSEEAQKTGFKFHAFLFLIFILALAISPYYIFQQPSFQQAFMNTSTKTQYSQTSLLQETATGNIIWSASAHNMAEQKNIIKNNRIVSAHMSLVNISALDAKSGKSLFSFQQAIEKPELSKLQLFEGEKSIWLYSQQPFYLAKINQQYQVDEFESIQEFSDQEILKETKKTIEVYQYGFNSYGVLALMDSTGDEYVYDLSSENLQVGNRIQVPTKQNYLSGRFKLDKRGDIHYLSLPDQKNDSKNSWRKKLLLAKLIYSNNHQALLVHAPSLMPSNKRLVSLINQQGKTIWQQEISITERAVSAKQYNKLHPRLILDKDENFIIAISSKNFSTRYIALERNSGDFIWQREI